MQTSKIWQILVFVFPAYLYGFVYAVDFEPCFPAVKNEPCNMTCRFPDFSQVIEFTCGSSIRSTCSALLCDGMIKEGGNTLYLPISSPSYSNDNCEWSCTYGGNSATSATVTIFSGYSNLTLTGEKSSDGVKLTATAECLYPSNSSVNVEYSYESEGKFVSLGQQQIDIQSFNVPGVCNFGIENRTTAISYVSGKLAIFEGKNVYFKMGFSQYTYATPSYTNEFPFYFEDCSQDIFLYGFLPVFLIVLIASIPINILKIDFLSKQFGEFTWKKVGITAVFCVIAIIIGVCLGLLIKGCDKKLLALGLSLFFGILLVVALIFALIYYHKKCESGSDIQDGDGGEDSNRSSQNNTGSNTTRTGTGRVGSPASTSNVELAANLKSES